MELIRKSGPDVPVIKENNNVYYLTYPNLSACDGFVHAFSTRRGGVSKGVFESMNLSFSRGDVRDDVYENFRRFTKAIGVRYESVVMSDQTHTVNVRRVGSGDKGNGLLYDKKFFDTDGLVTNEPGVTLTTSYADCVPLFFIDPVNKAIGLSHSGWRGTVGRIGKITVEKMVSEFGSNPGDIVAAIGPSICADCYEVSEDVAKAFREEFNNRAEEIVFSQKEYYDRHKIDKPSNAGKYQLDLWKANEIVLTEAGISKDNLSITNICTCCNCRELFSHRASNGKRGNLVAMLMICDDARHAADEVSPVFRE